MTSIRSLGLEVVRISGGHEMVLCPFHADTTASAWFNPRKSLFYCAVCGIGKNIQQLAVALGVEWDGEDWDIYENIPEYSMIGGSEPIDIGNAIYHPYMEYRKITQRVVDDFGLRFKDYQPEAVVFPVTTLSGTHIGAVYRFIGGGQRYKKVGEMTPIWPLHFLIKATVLPKHLIVTEGGFSALRLAPLMYSDEMVVSTLGALANERIVDITAPFEAVTFLYDDDIAGDRACRKMRKLAPLRKAFTLSKAPDDMTDLELIQLADKLRRLYE